MTTRQMPPAPALTASPSPDVSPVGLREMVRQNSSSTAARGGDRAGAAGPPAGRRRGGNETPSDPVPAAAIDVYAMTNPALCGLVLTAFLSGRAVAAGEGVHFALLFLPVPLVLSQTLRARFDRTTRATGLFEWLGRHPDLAVGFGERVGATAAYTRDGLLFAGRYDFVRWDDAGRAHATEACRAVRSRRASAEIRDALRAAQRLGGWIADVRSTATALHAFGIAPAVPR